jgi:hypothetical protein
VRRRRRCGCQQRRTLAALAASLVRGTWTYHRAFESIEIGRVNQSPRPTRPSRVLALASTLGRHDRGKYSNTNLREQWQVGSTEQSQTAAPRRNWVYVRWPAHSGAHAAERREPTTNLTSEMRNHRQQGSSQSSRSTNQSKWATRLSQLKELSSPVRTAHRTNQPERVGHQTVAAERAIEPNQNRPPNQPTQSLIRIAHQTSQPRA